MESQICHTTRGGESLVIWVGVWEKRTLGRESRKSMEKESGIAGREGKKRWWDVITGCQLNAEYEACVFSECSEWNSAYSVRTRNEQCLYSDYREWNSAYPKVSEPVGTYLPNTVWWTLTSNIFANTRSRKKKIKGRIRGRVDFFRETAQTKKSQASFFSCRRLDTSFTRRIYRYTSFICCTYRALSKSLSITSTYVLYALK